MEPMKGAFICELNPEISYSNRPAVAPEERHDYRTDRTAPFQAPSAAACAHGERARRDMPLLTELGSSHRTITINMPLLRSFRGGDRRQAARL